MQTQFIGTKSAAELLQQSEPTVRRRSNDGELACQRTETGRRLFRLEDVMRLVASDAQKPGRGAR